MNDKNFNKIFNKYKPHIQLFLRQGWGIKHEDIEEITNDVIFILYQKSKNPLFIFNKSYIYKISRNKAIDFIRKNNNVENELFTDYAIEYSSPERILLESDERIFIRHFLSKLSNDNRQIAYLFYYEDLSCKKISSILNMPAGTIKYRLYQIRENLKKEYFKNENSET